MEKKYYWKVVRIERDQKKKSAYNNPFEITYYFNRWAKPKIGKIFVFNTRKAARDFRSRYNLTIFHTWKVFKCECKGISLGNYRSEFTNKEEILYFWSMNDAAKKFRFPYSISGTLYADSIKLIK